MDFSCDEQDQLYLIEWDLPQDIEVAIGKLGTYHFQQGRYVYIGSAKKNIRARIERHLKIEKKTRWHMDYLRPYVEPVKVLTVSFHKGECSLKQFIQKTYGGQMIMKGFGSSDCNCDSHLLKLPVPIDDKESVKNEWLKY